MTASTEMELTKALRSLELADVLLDTSLRLPENMALAQYERFGAALSLFARAGKWWLGDWIIYGEATYGEKYAQAVDITGFSSGYLRNVVYVCSRITPSRRRKGVPFSVHYEVAKLKPADQKRWLSVAAKESLTSTDLRNRIQEEERLLAAHEQANGNGRSDRSDRSQASKPPTPDRQAGTSLVTPAILGTGSPAATSATGLPTAYVVNGALVRRLCKNAVATRDGFYKVPRDTIDKLRHVLDE